MYRNVFSLVTGLVAKVVYGGGSYGVGPNDWGSTGANHWGEIDEDHAAPDSADRISALGAAIEGKIERFGMTTPNKNNLEGGFDRIALSVYAWRTTGAEVNDIPLYLNVYVKGGWQTPQTVIIIGGGAPAAAWYSAVWSVFCCDKDDADDVQEHIEIGGPLPGDAYQASDGVYVATTYIGITGNAILTTAKAKLSAQMI
jgi:hypothetical protein